MNNCGLTKENLLSTLPAALREDASIAALAEAAAELLAARRGEISRLTLYPAIGRLEEPVLDALAWDFKVDWWDGDYSLEEKRRTLQDSWKVHKLLGTKAAVETAIRAVYQGTTVEEWFEYRGQPYGFKINLDLTGTEWTEDRPRRILERVEFYKSLRSHLDAMEYVRESKEAAALRVGGSMSTVKRIPIPAP